MTVTVQLVAAGRSALGSSVIVALGEPLTLKLFGVPLGHSRLNELVETVTDSLKVTVMFVLVATWVAPLAGDVLSTDGAWSFGVTITGNSLDVHWEGSLMLSRST